MSRITLFEQSIENDRETSENTYIKLEVDEESQLFISNSKLIGMNIKEVTGASTFIITMSILDVFGDLVNHAIVEGGFVFYLTIGLDEFNNVQYQMKPSKISTSNSASSSSKSYVYSITFVSDKWTSFFLERKNRSWKEQTYSEIVQEIVDEIGFEETYITDTDNEPNITIQPYWTDFEMLRWLRKRSHSESGAGFDFGLTCNGGFFFGSYGDLCEQEDIGIHGVDEIGRTLSMQTVSDKDYEKGFRKIERIEVVQDYMIAMKSGASGVSHSHYDYMNKEYVTKEEVKFSESDLPHLSEKAFISEGDEITGSTIYSFSDTESELLANQKMAFSSSKIQAIRAHVPGVTDVHVGNVVEVQIPLGPDTSQLPFNELMSGKYLVTAREINVDTNGFSSSILRLTRHGVNTDETITLVESSVGRL